ncbi:MAG TPA: hypothetical protein PKY59_12645 [Pyrinomonadaceae bacterium]|nr:hypothetical protein [Pyrinomonadaceae bacterium]
MNKLTIRKKAELLKVWISPCNENQELNYMETFSGTPEAIIRHSLEIIEGLQKVLKLGTFSVKIESSNLTECVYVDAENVYDHEFNIISEISESHQFLK